MFEMVIVQAVSSRQCDECSLWEESLYRCRWWQCTV